MNMKDYGSQLWLCIAYICIYKKGDRPLLLRVFDCSFIPLLQANITGPKPHIRWLLLFTLLGVRGCTLADRGLANGNTRTWDILILGGRRGRGGRRTHATHHRLSLYFHSTGPYWRLCI